MSVRFKFVGGEFLDGFGDEPVNYSIKAVDFQKVDVSFNDFSKSFMIPATPLNNQIFKYYFDPSIIDSFNPFAENKAEMWVNQELYSTGQITLIDIDIVSGNPQQYQIQFYSDTIDLESALNDKGIDQLSWSGLDHSATASLVRDYLVGGAVVPGTNLKYVMASTSNFWSWEGFTGVEGVREIRSTKDGILNREVRPAIPVSDVMDKIFEDAGFDYEVDFALEDYYKELYMWINNGKRFLSVANQVAQGNSRQTIRFDSIPSKVIFPDEGVNDLKMYSTITGIITVSGAISADYTLRALFNLKGSNTASWRYVKNGTPSAWFTATSGISDEETLLGLISGDEIYIEVMSNERAVTSSNHGFYFENTDITAQDYFVTKSYMPTIKCVEFIRGILVNFNAIMYWDVENRKFIIKNREAWYAEGVEIDISDNLDTAKSKIKPPTFYKEYSFEFAEALDFRNIEYKGINNRGYGGSNFSTGMYAGDTYTNKSPFTPSIWVEVVTEAANGTISFSSDVATTQSIDDSFAPVESGTRLMYYNGSKTAAGSYKVVDYAGTSGGSNTTYNFFASALVSDSNLNLAFNSELDFKSSGGVLLENSLYTRFYADYINTIYNQNVRRLNISANIPYNKLKSIKINDTIVINRTRFLIDGITVDLTTNRATFDLINKI